MLDSHKMIDFDSHIPYYFQLIEVLKEKINQGEWKPGDQITSEPELCEIYGISRTVVRQALKEMEYEGLIYRRKGKGTFIAEPKIGESLVQKLTGFYQDMVERGYKPVTQVLRHEIVPANAKIARHLGLEQGTLVFVIERLRFVEEVPILLVTTYLPYELCPKLGDYDLSDKSLYAVLEKEFGIKLSHGRRTIEAVAANEREAELLQVDECAPLVLLDSVTYLEDGTSIEYYHAVHRGDRSRFEVELVRMHEQEELQEAIETNGIELPNSN
ncbi:MAG: GntR family transcriptional regulator [Anaerolineales bacterium]|nr:GntR family transcriptional regulator [Anaerolineales bacterium]